MPSPEPPGSPSQYRSPSRGSSMGPVSSSQPYTLHSLEEVHYHPLTTSSSYPVPSTSFPCPPYMSSTVSDLVSKMVTEEATDSHASLPPNSETHSCWAKEDGVSSWSPYEIRRAYWPQGGGGIWGSGFIRSWRFHRQLKVTSTSRETQSNWLWNIMLMGRFCRIYKDRIKFEYVGRSVVAPVDLILILFKYKTQNKNKKNVFLCLICIKKNGGHHFHGV